MIRVLRPGDEGVLEGFLSGLPDTSMFLRANARAAGLEDRGEPMQATYAAAFADGGIRSVAAHCWNGVLLLQAPEELEAVSRAAISASRRELKGIIGPAPQVRAARDALGIRSPRIDDVDRLYTLDLASLRVPAELSRATLRRPREEELTELIAWREAFLLETKLAAAGPGLREEARSWIELAQARGDHWVLESGGEVVAYTAFNARLPDIVQVGGVWTPPAQRGRGFARSAVAGSLLEARDHGARRAILFTNTPHAARAYEAIGFQHAGGYGLLFP